MSLLRDNIGRSRGSNGSVQEAITLCEEVTGREMNTEYIDENYIGDHIRWISDIFRFRTDYPDWPLTYDIRAILTEIHAAQLERTGVSA